MNKNLRIKFSIFATYFFFAILLNSTGVVILLVQSFFNVAETAASVLDPYKDLSIAFSSFIAGIFLTRIGYKKSILFSLGLTTIVCFIVPTISTFWSIKLICAVGGLTFGITKVAVFGSIGLVTNSSKEHLSLMNYIEGVFMVGILFGFLIYSYMSEDVMSGRWLYTYYVIGAISFLAFISLLFSELDESQIQTDENSDSNDFKLMLRLVLLPTIMVFVICAFLNVLIEQSTMNWLPTFNKKILGLSEPLAIVLGSILSGSMAVGRLLAGFVLKRIEWSKVLTGCIVGAMVVLLISMQLSKGAMSSTEITNFSDIPFVAFFFPLIGLFLSPVYPAINSIILNSLPKKKHAAMASLIVIFSAVGGSLGSIITGALFEHFGGINAFYCSIIPMTLLVITLFGFKKLVGKETDF